MIDLKLLIDIKEHLESISKKSKYYTNTKNLLERIGEPDIITIKGKEFSRKQVIKWIDELNLYNSWLSGGTTSPPPGVSIVSIVKEIRAMYNLELKEAKDIFDLIRSHRGIIQSKISVNSL